MLYYSLFTKLAFETQPIYSFIRVFIPSYELEENDPRLLIPHKQTLGDRLYPRVSKYYRSQAGKITG